ncbi:MAG: bifunctional (p)ppGpp synthetase/guanosine-3',5'-bis(diphosphate) 3'-pyrophosphohydrolase, partial [Eubacterium sp.]|nr:bifunctional (p)ppGpp synthetase/guanosine-3',5'-bis(diphosphate) 3'-pyrophosphohydrolase [Eubacterium sp.]
MKENNCVLETKGIQNPDDSLKKADTSPAPDELYAQLRESVEAYHPSTDLSLIRKAYQTAMHAHGSQLRLTGEPFIIHPLRVAIILADLELDKETIEAALLHDVLEDTDMKPEEMAHEFGDEVTGIVNGVTKLTRLNYTRDKIEEQAENLRKMFLAMSKDIRVILVKLADRLHNMRTLQYMRREKQLEKARETIDIYSPIAQRLGLSKIKNELDDLSLKYLEPEKYYEIVHQLNEKKAEREALIDRIVSDVRANIDQSGIEAEVYGRAKHLFSIYRKMVNQGRTLDQIYDLFAVRIIVKTIRDC